MHSTVPTNRGNSSNIMVKEDTATSSISNVIHRRTCGIYNLYNLINIISTNTSYTDSVTVATFIAKIRFFTILYNKIAQYCSY